MDMDVQSDMDVEYNTEKQNVDGNDNSFDVSVKKGRTFLPWFSAYWS